MAAGDALAKGASKAQFPPAGGRVSQQKWDSIFEDFDAEAYKRGGNADAPADGNVGAQSGSSVPDATGF